MKRSIFATLSVKDGYIPKEIKPFASMVFPYAVLLFVLCVLIGLIDWIIGSVLPVLFG